MNELIKFVKLIETALNRPFGILVIAAGLSFLLIAVLFKLGDIENKTAHITFIIAGTIMILTGIVVHMGHLIPGWPTWKFPEIVQQRDIPEPSAKKISVPESDEPELFGEESDETPRSETETPPADPGKEAHLYYIPIIRFEFIWNDRANRSGQTASFYRPLAPAGYKILGHHVRPDGRPPHGGGLAVKLPHEPDNKGILAYPARYERIYVNHQADSDLTVWRPVPRPGYTCLGDMVSTDTVEPDRKALVCVRTSLTTEGVAGESIWEHRGLGSAGEISICPILPKDPVRGMSLNLFQGYGGKRSRVPAYGAAVLRKEYVKLGN